MNFKQLKEQHGFHLCKASFSNRIYSNSVYDIIVNNNTQIATLSRSRNNNTIYSFNINDNDIVESMLVY